MAMGLTRREQWGLIGVIALIALGMGVQGWRRMQPDPPVVYKPGQGRWEKVADFEAGQRPAAALPSPAPGVTGENARTTATLAKTAETKKPQSGGLDINRATAEEFERLPGIGPSKARAILEARGRLGGFDSVERLDAVPGIGAKTLERLRPFLKVEAAAAHTATPGPTSAQPPGTLIGRLNPAPAAAPTPTPAAKTASTPGTAGPGPVVDVNHATAEELDKLPGIGPAMAQRIIEERTAHGPFREPRDLIRVKGIGQRNLEKMLPQVVAGPTGRNY